MRLKLDLHVHSERSVDGRMSLEQIASLARERGLNGFAVCDHDEVLGTVPEFDGLVVIPGTEVSCREGHLLGYFVREKITARTVREAAEQIHAQGGIAVLAHPFEHKAGPERFAELTLLSEYVDGFEVLNSRADRKIRNANRLAMEFCHTDPSSGKVFSVPDLNMVLPPAEQISGPIEAATAGSDAHLPEEVGGAWTEFDCGGTDEESLKAALLSSENNRFVRGVRSRAVCAALSGYTSRKKSGVPAAEWAKWLAFYCKCAAEDLRYRGDRNILHP